MMHTVASDPRNVASDINDTRYLCYCLHLQHRKIETFKVEKKKNSTILNLKSTRNLKNLMLNAYGINLVQCILLASRQSSCERLFKIDS